MQSARATAAGHAAARQRRQVRNQGSESSGEDGPPSLVAPSYSSSEAPDLVMFRGRTVYRGNYHSTAAPRNRNPTPKGKAYARNAIRVRWGGQWGTMHRLGWTVIDLDYLTIRMRLRRAIFKVLHLIRLRRLWSQLGALMQVAGRRTYFLRARELVWTVVSTCIPTKCRRYRSMEAGGQPWSLQQAWGYLGPIVRRGAPLFKHLVSRHGHLTFRSVTRERSFRAIVKAQIAQSHWWNWTPVAQSSDRILSTPI